MKAPMINFYRRLVAMYGEHYAVMIFTDKTGQDAPKLIEEKAPLRFNLNEM